MNESTSLNESPSEKEGKYLVPGFLAQLPFCLNESPSEKEGKSKCLRHPGVMYLVPQ